MKFPKWQLHRGYWKAGVRENTMEAFNLAYQEGIDMVEMDVQISRDGVPHVYHDWTLKRFFHIDKKVVSLKSEELSGLGIPKLDDVLASSKVPQFLNVEVKSNSIFCFKVSRMVSRTIESSDSQKKILISSFNPMVLFWFRLFLPKVPRALIVGDSKLLKSWLFSVYMNLADPEFINSSFELIEEKITRDRLLQFEKPLMVWTVNDYVKAKTYLERGARSIISDVLPE